jgi:hypothetical protein
MAMLRISTHGLAVQSDQPFLRDPPLSHVRMLLQRPRDLYIAPGVTALAQVRCGVVTAVRPRSQTGRPPVQVEVRRMAPHAPCETAQAPAPPCTSSTLADVKEARLALRPEPVDTRRRRDGSVTVSFIEVLPLRPGQPAPVRRLGAASGWRHLACHMRRYLRAERSTSRWSEQYAVDVPRRYYVGRKLHGRPLIMCRSGRWSMWGCAMPRPASTNACQSRQYICLRRSRRVTSGIRFVSRAKSRYDYASRMVANEVATSS